MRLKNIVNKIKAIPSRDIIALSAFFLFGAVCIKIGEVKAEINYKQIQIEELKRVIDNYN